MSGRVDGHYRPLDLDLVSSSIPILFIASVFIVITEVGIMF